MDLQATEGFADRRCVYRDDCKVDQFHHFGWSWSWSLSKNRHSVTSKQERRLLHLPWATSQWIILHHHYHWVPPFWRKGILRRTAEWLQYCRSSRTASICCHVRSRTERWRAKKSFHALFKNLQVNYIKRNRHGWVCWAPECRWDKRPLL